MKSLTPASELAQKRSWRIDAKQLAALREAAHLFEGTLRSLWQNDPEEDGVGEVANLRQSQYGLGSVITGA